MQPPFWFKDETSTVGNDEFVPILPFLWLVLVPWYEYVGFDGVVALEAGHAGADRCSRCSLEGYDACAGYFKEPFKAAVAADETIRLVHM